MGSEEERKWGRVIKCVRGRAKAETKTERRDGQGIRGQYINTASQAGQDLLERDKRGGKGEQPTQEHSTRRACKAVPTNKHI